MRTTRVTDVASSTLAFVFALSASGFQGSLHAQPAAPHYEECRLDSIYPVGGQRGTSVKVEFRGIEAGLSLPRDIIVDGPPGIVARDLKSVSGRLLEATLDIAPDAAPGRRFVRVLNERSGLTNCATFVVGRLPEQLEAEPNNVEPQGVKLPVVVNGRVDPGADIDLYRFSAKAGEPLVAAVAAHAIDIHGQYKSYGIADFSLDLLDAQGRTIATAEDTLGFDPLINLKVPADGEYTIRVQLLNYGGFPEAVYRLTLGAVPYVTGVFPPGAQRGVSTPVELFGPNVPAGTLREVLFPVASKSPQTWLTLHDVDTAGTDVPLAIGDFAESREIEPNDSVAQAHPILGTEPVTINARFDRPGDADWYRLKLEAGQKVRLETVAHRFLRSPVDTVLQVFDTQGKLLAENDDDPLDPGYECFHDYKTTDSELTFAAPAAGEYLVKIAEQASAGGERAMYRFTVKPALPDFHLRHFPDAVPVWGPGTTAAVLVRVDRFEVAGDIDLAVEGLPEGWKTSGATSLSTTPQQPYNFYSMRQFLTITAPADAQPGTAVPFRIVGRMKLPPPVATAATGQAPQPVATNAAPVPAQVETVEHESLPLTLLYTSDTGFFRFSPVSRAAVARPQGPWLEALTNDITVAPGTMTTLPVRIHNAGDLKQMPIVLSIATNGVATSLTPPQNLPITDGKIEVPLVLPTDFPRRHSFSLVVAQTWRSDIRIGMPGPCTQLIRLKTD